jgi:hypothetical protein
MKLTKIKQPELSLIYHQPLIDMLERCVKELQGEPSAGSPRAAAEKLLKEIRESTP